MILIFCDMAARVCVVGAGVAGSAFTHRLLELLPRGRARVSVFEMGRGAGGRASVRRHDPCAAVRHGAPAFDVKTPAGRSAVEPLLRKGLVHQWRGAALGTIRLSGGSHVSSTAVPVDAHTLFYLDDGMCGSLLAGADALHFGTRVDGVVQEDTGWTVRPFRGDNDEQQQHFDWVVLTSPLLAHDRRWGQLFGGAVAPLGSSRSTPNADANANADSADQLLLDALGEDSTPSSRAVVSLISVFKEGEVDQYPFDLAHVEDSDVLAKVVKQRHANGVVSLVAHSTAAFAASDGVRDLRGSSSTAARAVGGGDDGAAGTAAAAGENDAVRRRLQAELGAVLEPWLGETGVQGTVAASHQVHRWGAAFPGRHTFFAGPLLSRVVPEVGLAVCGDFLGDAPARVETALLSGFDAAEQLAARLQ